MSSPKTYVDLVPVVSHDNLYAPIPTASITPYQECADDEAPASHHSDEDGYSTANACTPTASPIVSCPVPGCTAKIKHLGSHLKGFHHYSSDTAAKMLFRSKSAARGDIPGWIQQIPKHKFDGYALENKLSEDISNAILRCLLHFDAVADSAATTTGTSPKCRKYLFKEGTVQHAAQRLGLHHALAESDPLMVEFKKYLSKDCSLSAATVDSTIRHVRYMLQYSKSACSTQLDDASPPDDSPTTISHVLNYDSIKQFVELRRHSCHSSPQTTINYICAYRRLLQFAMESTNMEHHLVPSALLMNRWIARQLRTLHKECNEKLAERNYHEALEDRSVYKSMTAIFRDPKVIDGVERILEKRTRYNHLDARFTLQYLAAYICIKLAQCPGVFRHVTLFEYKHSKVIEGVRHIFVKKHKTGFKTPAKLCSSGNALRLLDLYATQMRPSHYETQSDSSPLFLAANGHPLKTVANVVHSFFKAFGYRHRNSRDARRAFQQLFANSTTDDSVSASALLGHSTKTAEKFYRHPTFEVTHREVKRISDFLLQNHQIDDFANAVESTDTSSRHQDTDITPGNNSNTLHLEETSIPLERHQAEETHHVPEPIHGDANFSSNGSSPQQMVTLTSSEMPSAIELQQLVGEPRTVKRSLAMCPPSIHNDRPIPQHLTGLTRDEHVKYHNRFMELVKQQQTNLIMQGFLPSKTVTYKEVTKKFEMYEWKVDSKAKKAIKKAIKAHNQKNE